MKYYLNILLASGVLLTACSKDQTTNTTANENAVTSNDSLTVDSAMVNTPGEANTVAANSASGLNPEHGQPGHRCDIPVGAPLNSAPSVTQAPVAATGGGFNTNPLAQSRSVNTPAPVAVPTPAPAPQPAPQPPAKKTAPGMNPPHGEPGHRCDIAVGAPLSSAPAKPAAAPQQTQTITPVSNPAPVAEKAATASTAPGMNPPHGEPGHRCDIAVGAPLK
ncbi:MAG: hypothetical protein ABS44_06315 [Chryseobacterium sp. SCN 40-13]|nr:MAG: hypothetical protein ABS44_06315 [Chryseobacterium sp. SCN 40-13]